MLPKQEGLKIAGARRQYLAFLRPVPASLELVGCRGYIGKSGAMQKQPRQWEVRGNRLVLVPYMDIVEIRNSVQNPEKNFSIEKIKTSILEATETAEPLQRIA